MLGGATKDEDFPPGDEGFDPNNFFYHGYGQMGQGQGPPPPSPDTHNPANGEFLDALGWGFWPEPQQQQPDQAQNDGPPNLIPLQQAEANAVQHEEVIQAPANPVVVTPLSLIQSHRFWPWMTILNHQKRKMPCHHH